MQKPITITQNFSVQQTILKFLEKKISRLIVIESKSSIGMVTAKDVGFFLLNDESEKSLDSIPVSELMKPIISVDRFTSIKKCAQIMTDKGIGSLGIISDNHLIGIVTKTDLVKYYEENSEDLRKKSQKLFGDKFVAFRTELKVISYIKNFVKS